jgi:hypothetical protein
LRQAAAISPSAGQIHFQLGTALVEIAQGKGATLVESGTIHPEISQEALKEFRTAGELIVAGAGRNEQMASRADAFYNGGMLAAMTNQFTLAQKLLLRAKKFEPTRPGLQVLRPLSVTTA